MSSDSPPDQGELENAAVDRHRVRVIHEPDARGRSVSQRQFGAKNGSAHVLLELDLDLFEYLLRLILVF